MKLKSQDNLVLFAVASCAAALEALIVGLWVASGPGGPFLLGMDYFLIMGHAYLFAVCAAIYLMGRRIIQPIDAILEGISLYGQGRLTHRIPRSKIQELDELARNLNRMAARLSEVDAMKNDLVANVSHELRSPLSAMESYVKLLLEEDGFSKRARENLRRVDGNLVRLRLMVEELLDAAQIESKTLKLETQTLDLCRLLKDVASLYEPLAAEHGLRFELLSCEKGLTLFADPAKVRQVLGNLLDNAVKYNRPGGSITISAKPEGSGMNISVQDSGGGIPAHLCDSIFERFRRLPPIPGTAKIRGAGLGLSISRGLAQAMGGTVRVRSEEGVGSTFELILPVGGES